MKKYSLFGAALLSTTFAVQSASAPIASETSIYNPEEPLATITATQVIIHQPPHMEIGYDVASKKVKLGSWIMGQKEGMTMQCDQVITSTDPSLNVIKLSLQLILL